MHGSLFFTLLNSDIVPKTQAIEVSTSLQIPSFQIIGLPGPEVSEAKDRIKSAIENSGFIFPKRKVILNLSPASVRKQGTGLDLAMALAVLLDPDENRRPKFRRIFAWGELGLAGRVKSVGQVTRAVAAALAERADLVLLSPEEFAELVRRQEEFPELTRVPIAIAPVSDLAQAIEYCEGSAIIPPLAFPTAPGESTRNPEPDSDHERVPNRKTAVSSPSSPTPICTPTLEAGLLPLPHELLRILAIASASRHHLLLLGAKGAGKSHALEWLRALQPPSDLMTRRMQSFLAELSRQRLDSNVRRVGAQVKGASLIGSFRNSALHPGEFSLAHGGVLLADEFPEWARDAREALREPLERGWVTLTRVQGSTELPARFLFAANGNLCPCGGIYAERISAEETPCRCLPQHRRAYLDRLSGPILDRIDLIYVLRSSGPRKTGLRDSPSLSGLRERIERLRSREIREFGKPIGELDGGELENVLMDSPAVSALLDRSGAKSLRDRHKTLRIALSLAHWDEKNEPGELHFVEARLYRGALLQRELDGGGGIQGN